VTVTPSFDARVDLAGTCGTFQHDAREQLARYPRVVNVGDFDAIGYDTQAWQPTYGSWAGLQSAIVRGRERRAENRSMVGAGVKTRVARERAARVNMNAAAAKRDSVVLVERQKDGGHGVVRAAA
jgi:hypothetical protein